MHYDPVPPEMFCYDMLNKYKPIIDAPFPIKLYATKDVKSYLHIYPTTPLFKCLDAIMNVEQTNYKNRRLVYIIDDLFVLCAYKRRGLSMMIIVYLLYIVQTLKPSTHARIVAIKYKSHSSESYKV